MIKVDSKYDRDIRQALDLTIMDELQDEDSADNNNVYHVGDSFEKIQLTIDAY